MFRGINTNAFTPSGRILQMQYALEASQLGATSFGICTEEVLILAAEKRPVSPLMVAGALDKIVELDSHLYCTVSGMLADARSLIAPARIACLNHWMDYQEYLPIETLVDSMARQAINFGMGDNDDSSSSSSSGSGGTGAGGSGGSGGGNSNNSSSSSSDSNEESDNDNSRLLTTCRPYGAAFLLGGIDNDQLQLWHLQPTGEFGRHGIKAIGSGSDAAENWLVRYYQPSMDMNRAMDLALSTMQMLIGEQSLAPAHLDLMVMNKGPRCHQLTGKELELQIVRHQGLENSD